MDSLFSVVILNCEQTHVLKVCLDSVLNQDYDNIELILCDDASCDFDPQEMGAYIERKKSAKIKKVIIFKQDRYRGLSACCQKAFELSSGVYIKYLTPTDSFIDTNALRDACKAFVEYDADILATKAVVTSDNKKAVSVEQDIAHYDGHFIDSATVFGDVATQYDESFIFSHAAFLKREAIEKAGGFDPRYEHVAFWPIWLKASAVGAKFYYTNKKLVVYKELSAMTFQPQLIDAENIEKHKEFLNILEEQVQPRMKTRFSIYAKLKYMIFVKRIEQDIISISDWRFMGLWAKAVWKIRNLPYRFINSLYTIRTTDYTPAFKHVSTLLLLCLLLLKTDLSAGSFVPIREAIQVLLLIAFSLDSIYVIFILFQKFCNRIARSRYENK